MGERGLLRGVIHVEDSLLGEARGGAEGRGKWKKNGETELPPARKIAARPRYSC